MLLSHWHLLRPWWLLALIPLGLIVMILWRNSKVDQRWQKVCDPKLLPHLLVTAQTSSRRYAIFMLGMAWFCVIVALSGPTWQRLPQSLYQTQQAQVIVLDLSANMLAADIKPKRITRARYKVLDLLQRSKEHQTGLVVFTRKPFVVSPLTQDAQTIAAMVPILSPDIIPIAGQNIGAALQKAVTLLQQAGMRQGQIILITASQPTEEDNKIAAHLKQQGFSLSILGVGTVLGAPIASTDEGEVTLAKLDSVGLQRLATLGGGRFIPFSEVNADIDSLLLTTSRTSLTATQTMQMIEIWVDQGYWWIIPVLLIVAFLFRRGWFEALTQ